MSRILFLCSLNVAGAELTAMDTTVTSYFINHVNIFKFLVWKNIFTAVMWACFMANKVIVWQLAQASFIY